MEPIEAAGDVRDDAPAAAELLERSQENARLATCLGELEERQSTAIRSAFIDGNTYEDLSERMGVPLGTMKSWIAERLIKLKACLER